RGPKSSGNAGAMPLSHRLAEVDAERQRSVHAPGQPREIPGRNPQRRALTAALTSVATLLAIPRRPATRTPPPGGGFGAERCAAPQKRKALPHSSTLPLLPLGPGKIHASKSAEP